MEAWSSIRLVTIRKRTLFSILPVLLCESVAVTESIHQVYLPLRLPETPAAPVDVRLNVHEHYEIKARELQYKSEMMFRV